MRGTEADGRVGVETASGGMWANGVMDGTMGKDGMEG